VTRVGQIPDPIQFPPGPHYAEESFVPLARSIGGFIYVIGFGRVRVEVAETPGNSPTRFRITKLAGGVRAWGPTAISPLALEALAASPLLRLAHADFADPVTAPVLVR
jgi:hypothetical protein